MKEQLLHTPDGVRDIYNGESRTKLKLQELLHQSLRSFGYQDIQTPTFEFFDIFGKEIGTTPSKDLYKFFDKEGNTLVLRPDFTPAVARSAVKYFSNEDIPVKLCYMGNTFINSSDYQGRLKENTQCGAELIGDDSIAGDAEILAMVVDALKCSGLKEFQLSVGHAQFFAGLIEAAGISEEDEQTLRDLINNKNFFGVEEFVETLSIDENLKRLSRMLGNFNLKEEELEKAARLAADYPVIGTAIDHLNQLNEFLKIYGIDKYITFEPGLISDYHYYTGIIFAGFTFGTGEPIVRGGRYDKLLSYFGKNIPSIGFAIVVDQLMAALSRQKIMLDLDERGTLLIYDQAHAPEAIGKANMLRRENGCIVDMQMQMKGRSRKDYEEYAKKKHLTKIEFMCEL